MERPGERQTWHQATEQPAPIWCVIGNQKKHTDSAPEGTHTETERQRKSEKGRKREREKRRKRERERERQTDLERDLL